MSLKGIKNIRLGVLIATVFVQLGSFNHLLALDEIPAESTEQLEDSTIIQPKEINDSFYERGSSDNHMVWSVYLFLFMVAVILGLWVYSRKGGLSLNRLSSSNDLKIRETKPLGNRQFLIVVEYGEQKMLLGVAPGVINHLCYLEDPADPDEGI